MGRWLRSAVVPIVVSTMALSMASAQAAWPGHAGPSRRSAPPPDGLSGLPLARAVRVPQPVLPDTSGVADVAHVANLAPYTAVERHGPTGDTTITYDPVGNPTAIVDPSGRTEYRYTAVNEVELITEPSGGRTTVAYQPDDDTRRASVTLPNGVTTRYGYQPSGKVRSITSVDAGGTVLVDLAYQYRAAGGSGGERSLVQSMTDVRTGAATGYRYDAANRLVRATTCGGPTSCTTDLAYHLDANGNLIDGGRAYDAAQQLRGATFDRAGNQTADTAGTRLAYNGADQTTSVTPPGKAPSPRRYGGTTQDDWVGVDATTFFDAPGRGTTRATTDGQATDYSREPDGRLLSETLPDHRTYHYLFDARGSVVALTDVAGRVAQRYAYTPYGQQTEPITVANPYQFQGGHLDPTSGLIKLGTRWYQPTLGRWTQPDPDPDEPRYTYAHSNPVNDTDPTGRGFCLFGHSHASDGDSSCKGAKNARKHTAGAIAGVLGASTCGLLQVGLGGPEDPAADYLCYMVGGVATGIVEDNDS